jgi:hypothetical protein
MKVLNAVSVQSRKRVLEKLKSGLSFVLHTSRQIGRDGRVRIVHFFDSIRSESEMHHCENPAIASLNPFSVTM